MHNLISFLVALSLSQQTALDDLAYLSSTALAGRETNSAGAQKAAHYIAKRFSDLSLSPYNQERFLVPFTYKVGLFSQKTGVNVVASMASNKESWLVITAHYDHLGKQGGKIYHGADDNASGVAAMLSLAEALKDKPLNHNILFVATDAEENGLHGANAITEQLITDGLKIKLNINLDMLAGDPRPQQLYAFYDKELRDYKALVEVKLQNAYVKSTNGRHFFRYDQGSLGFSTNIKRLALESSDHYAFARRDIPFIYFGVGTHKHYHQPSDIFENIDASFFLNNIKLIEKAIINLDSALATAE